MANIVLGIGSSHSPMLTLDSEEWVHRSLDDQRNKNLNLSDGRWVSYQELLEEFGERYADKATSESLESIAAASEAALDRLSSALIEAQPDAVIIVGDDQGELFSPGSQPAIAIYYGSDIVMQDHWNEGDYPEWVHRMAVGYAMEDTHSFPGHPELALSLIKNLADRHIDIAVQQQVEDPHKAGFGHAFGFIINRLFRDQRIPVVPVLLNTYYPPNVVTSSRAFEIGRQLRGAIEEVDNDMRIAIIASGGLSHFVVDAELDRQVLEGFKPGQSSLLTKVPRGALNSGSSEILNWILMAGSIEHLQEDWVEYHPVYRTPAGTGCGLGFGLWRK